MKRGCAMMQGRPENTVFMVTMYDDAADVDVGDDDMAMEVQTINSIRHKILTP